jgi:hypothetical protein
MAKEKDAQFEKVAEELSGIREALEDICDELSELHQSVMVIGILKMVETRPDMKEKLEPIFKEMVSTFDADEDGV